MTPRELTGKPELCATCRTCKEVFPLGYNFCPDYGRPLSKWRKAAIPKE